MRKDEPAGKGTTRAGRGLPWSVRWVVAAYSAAARLLPAGFRRRYFDEAERDMADALDALHRRGGWRPVLVAGVGAMVDIVRRVPVEWWAALRGGHIDARRVRLGTGERMMRLGTDLRIAARALMRRPTYTIAATVTLALGIGATVAVFTVVNDVVIRPLPYPEANRIVTFSHHAPGLNLPSLDNSPGMLDFYWKQAHFFESLAGYELQHHNFLGGPRPDLVNVLAATPQIFRVLDVRPAVGRPFNAVDATEGATPVGLLMHAAWVSRFGADPSVVGRTVRLDGVATEVVGIMPAGFDFPDPSVVMMTPLHVDPNGSFGAFGMHAVARLAPGVTVGQAQSRIRDLQAGLGDFFPDITKGFFKRAGWGVTLERLQDSEVGAGTASTLWIVLATVGFVLLIACANVANLFLVRADSRRKELAVRSALGARRADIASGFLAEALLLGFAGGTAGVALAWAGVSLLVRSGPSALPRLDEVSVDGASLVFAMAVTLLTSLALATLPLLRYSRKRVASALREGGRGATEGRERYRARSALVAAQLALALVLLVGSGLMLRSFARLRAIDPGFDPENVLTVGLSFGGGTDPAQAASFYQRVADQVAALPGVRDVGLTTFVPMGGGDARGSSFFIDGKPTPDKALPPSALYKAVGAEYLKALHIKLLEGRTLTRADWNGGEPVALVNKAFADEYLGGKALGQGIRVYSTTAYARVVGVVADVHEMGIRHDVKPWAYLPMVEGKWAYFKLHRIYLVIRSDPGMTPPLASIRDIVGKLNASVPLTSARTMDEVMARDTAETSFTMILLGIAAAVALFLGAVGLFGVVSYVVGQRTREIGVRVALGASRGEIRSMVLRQSGGVALVGVTVGLGGAFGLTRLMASVLFQVSTTDPVSFAVAPVVLLAVVVTAAMLPAWRAARVDPVEALRAE